jgi:hypothetical protein
MEYRALYRKAIEEFCGYFDFEGIFMDMLFWPMICRCPSCQARWEKEVGGPMPDEVNWHDDRWLTFQKKRSDWMGEYALWATATLQKYKPGVAVEHQYSTIMHDWKFGVNENMAVAVTTRRRPLRRHRASVLRLQGFLRRHAQSALSST